MKQAIPVSAPATAQPEVRLAAVKKGPGLVGKKSGLSKRAFYIQTLKENVKTQRSDAELQKIFDAEFPGKVSYQVSTIRSALNRGSFGDHGFTSKAYGEPTPVPEKKFRRVGSKEAAKAAARKVEEALTTGALNLNAPEVRPFEKYAERWYAGHVNTNLKISTRRLARMTLDKALFPVFGKYPINEITRDDIKQFCYRMLESGRVKAHFPRHYPIFAAALYTGMRQGELVALKWDDLDAPEPAPFDPANLRKAFSSCLRRAGLRQIRFHDMRTATHRG